MLPITHHRAFHIPHGIATVAAMVALVTALGWNASGSESSGLEAKDAAHEQFTSAPGEAPAPAEIPDPAPVRSSDGEPDVLSGLLPLVLPSISGF